MDNEILSRVLSDLSIIVDNNPEVKIIFIKVFDPEVEIGVVYNNRYKTITINPSKVEFYKQFKKELEEEEH